MERNWKKQLQLLPHVPEFFVSSSCISFEENNLLYRLDNTKNPGNAVSGRFLFFLVQAAFLVFSNCRFKKEEWPLPLEVYAVDRTANSLFNSG